MSLYPPVTDSKTIDWANIPFDYVRTRSFIKYTWREGLWNEGELVTDGLLTMDVAGEKEYPLLQTLGKEQEY